ncbi:hypothetical protein CEUSTIGMA_g7483.t1 [Chlamydomonas eustigma]|uniref:Uncharacterized protein n=1 Tax=Chlamydomonas eustigma TaxID=1157962 RepID=A0A250XAF8_9CHLO|nr:hypothetical protein CEUSTIGMA_g7483.t1 [Chlamydomonas eustigma]|eukprot:GAX80044.1 hypothetical protein CEUSTIGMA_g7483.t1 [Chlamydomonas eustigma]
MSLALPKHQDAEVVSTSSMPFVRVHGADVPINWLVKQHDPNKYPNNVLSTPDQIRQSNKSIHWTKNREQLIAGAAAGVHLALFSFNLAFWGFEGMPQDRYNPSNIRLKLGIKPSRYGNMDGTKRIYYDNLARLEGID